MSKFLNVTDLISLISDLDGLMQYGKAQDNQVYIRYSPNESWLNQGFTDQITWDNAHVQYEKSLPTLNYYVQ